MQSQTLHTIQEQQGTIITALMPLLPLLQAIPLHIESARNSVNDTITKSSGIPVHASSYLRPARAISSIRREKRSSSTLRSDGPSSPSPRPSKRPRISQLSQRPDQPFKHAEEAASAVKETPPQVKQHPITPDPHPEDRPQGPAQTASSLPLSTATAPSSLNRQKSNAIAANIKTPRRPFAELFLKTQIQTEVPSLTLPSTSRSISTTSRSHLRLSSSPNASSSPRLSGITPSAQHPPRLLRVHSSNSEVVGVVHAQAPAEAAQKRGFSDNMRSALEKDEIPRLPLRTRVEPSNQPLTSRLSFTPSASSRSPVISRTALAPSGPPSIAVPRPFPLNPTLPLPKQTQLSGPGIPPPPQLKLPLMTQEARLPRSSMKPIPMSSMGIRERRSPFVS
jgi:hypothetical protein